MGHRPSTASEPGTIAMFRISRNGYNPILVVDRVADIQPAIRSLEPGRYYIDEIAREPRHAGQESRHWGIGIKQFDGSFVIKLDPLEM
jgi:hypothetical protein